MIAEHPTFDAKLTFLYFLLFRSWALRRDDFLAPLHLAAKRGLSLCVKRFPEAEGSKLGAKIESGRRTTEEPAGPSRVWSSLPPLSNRKLTVVGAEGANEPPAQESDGLEEEPVGAQEGEGLLQRWKVGIIKHQ